MSSTIFFFIFIPFLTLLLLLVNLIFAPHNPYEEKESAFECGFHSFLGQNRTQFSISFFIFALLFLLFDLEILLVYPYIVSAYSNSIYGLLIMLVFFTALTIGLGYELGKKALNIDSRQKLSISSYRKLAGIFIAKSYKKYFRRIERCSTPGNIKLNKSGYGFILAIFLVAYYFIVYITVIALLFVYNYLFSYILLNKYILNLIPKGFSSKLKVKVSLKDKIRYLFSKKYLIIAIPVAFILITFNIICFYKTGFTIINKSSSYLAIFIYSFITCVTINFITCYLNKASFFSKDNICFLLYSTLLLFCVKISLFEVLPILSPFVFFCLDKYIFTEHNFESHSSLFKSLKCFLSHIPFLNKFMFLLHETSNNKLILEIHKAKYNSLIISSKKVFIAKPGLSVPVHIVPFSNKPNILQIINPLLESYVVFESSMFVFNKSSSYLGVYFVSISNYRNLHTSLVHIKEVGILEKRGYFPNSEANFLKLASGKSKFIELEKTTFILYPNSLNFTKSNLTESLIKSTNLGIKSKKNSSLISGFNNVTTKAIQDNSFNKTPVIYKESNPYCNKGSNNYLRDILNNIPYEVLNPLVYMIRDQDIDLSENKGKGKANEQDIDDQDIDLSEDKDKGKAKKQDNEEFFKFADLSNPEELEKALLDLYMTEREQGLEDYGVFKLEGEYADYKAVCLFFNDLDRVKYALNYLQRNREILIQQESLPEQFELLISPIYEQYESYFDEEGNDIDSIIQSLLDLLNYLCTDEF